MEQLQNVNTDRRAAGQGCPHAPLIWPRACRGPPLATLGNHAQGYLSCTLFQPADQGTGPPYFPASRSTNQLTLPAVGLSDPAVLPLLRGFPRCSPRAGNVRALSRPPFLSSQPPIPGPLKVKHPSRTGPGMVVSYPRERSAFPGAGPGGESCSTTCRPRARPLRPAPSPPARPAEPARAAGAGGSGPPLSYNGRRRIRCISFHLLPYLNLGSPCCFC